MENEEVAESAQEILGRYEDMEASFVKIVSQIYQMEEGDFPNQEGKIAFIDASLKILWPNIQKEIRQFADNWKSENS